MRGDYCSPRHRRSYKLGPPPHAWGLHFENLDLMGFAKLGVPNFVQLPFTIPTPFLPARSQRRP